MISAALLADNEFKIIGLDRISWVVVSHLPLSPIVMLCNCFHRLTKLQLKIRQSFAPRIPSGKPLQNFIPPAVINAVIPCLNIVRNGIEAFAQRPALSSSLNHSSLFLVDMLEKRKVVVERGHIPTEPLELQGAARVHLRAQGQGLSWHEETSPAAQAQSQGLSEPSSPGTALPRPFWKR